MPARSIRTRLVLTASTAALAVGLLPLPALSAPVTAPGPTSAGSTQSLPIPEAVARALVWRAGAAVAQADRSQQTACMPTNPQPVVYHRNRLVLRHPNLTDAKAKEFVLDALDFIGSASTVTKVRRIVIPDVTAGAGDAAVEVADVIAVTITSEADPELRDVRIVRLVRTLAHDHPELEVAPDYFLSPTDGPVGMWPDDWPLDTDEVTDPRDESYGESIEIHLYDVGLPPDSQGERPEQVTRLAKPDREELDRLDPQLVVDHYFGGHTYAMAGVIATLAPGATMKAARITDATGIATDVTAATRMAKSLRKSASNGTWPDLIVNAFGSPACSRSVGTPNQMLPPVGLHAVSEAVDAHGKSMIIASAGNRSSARPFYPAAFEPVLAVGALDATADGDPEPWSSASRTAPPADFSNGGPWVDVWAPGVLLPTTHVRGFSFFEDGPVLDGKAKVSGTSFSGPYVTALLAEIMSSGRSAERARDDLLGSGVTCQTRHGIAVALTDLDATALTEAPPQSPVQC